MRLTRASSSDISVFAAQRPAQRPPATLGEFIYGRALAGSQRLSAERPLFRHLRFTRASSTRLWRASATFDYLRPSGCPRFGTRVLRVPRPATFDYLQRAPATSSCSDAPAKPEQPGGGVRALLLATCSQQVSPTRSAQTIQALSIRPENQYLRGHTRLAYGRPPGCWASVVSGPLRQAR